VRKPTLTILAVLTTATVGPVSTPAGEIAEASQAQLREWLRQYPDADGDGDGKLTVEEAEAYRRKLDRERSPERSDGRFPFRHEFTFAEMSDGVKIALAVGYPKGFDTESSRKWPTVFTLCGYTSATAPVNPGGFGDHCVTVNASIRGTGASGGALSPWTPRTWQDGYEIIENWIAKQPWSSGRVGIVGHSWPGLMGFFVATTGPPSLEAVCVSGLIEDFYRGACRIGGVRNCGFPVAWLNNYYSLDGPFNSGTAARLVRGIEESDYRRIVASRPRRDLADDMLWLLMYEPYDGSKWREQSLYTYASRIRAPVLMMQTYQDEQTGPTGLWLWKRVPKSVPKRLILSNGAHNVTPAATGEGAAWLRHWLLGEGDGTVADPERRVQVYFETHFDDGGAIRLNRPLEAADFPLPNTRWTRYYLRPKSRLSETPPEGGGPSARYRVAAGDPVDENERVEYALEFDEPTAICGPIVLSLWATTSTPDADLFALVCDRGPDGKRYGLQRGLLRASRRALDEEKSAYAIQDGDKLLIRPRHRHTRAEPVTPHRPYRFEIEIFVVGHVFRPGHQLVLRLSRPPLGDPIGVTKRGGPSYQYDSDRPPGTVTILDDAEHPSSLLLPVLPELPPIAAHPPPLEKTAGLQLAP
jgi:predicted acyl esterase